MLFLVLFLTAAATGTGLLGPKLLGDATTHVFNGLIGSKLPAGMDKATIVAGLRAQGKTRFADMLVGAGTATLDVTDLATTLGRSAGAEAYGSGWWQANWWPSPIWTSGGISNRQRSVAFQQRVLNTQPVGGFIGLGRSPDRMIRSR